MQEVLATYIEKFASTDIFVSCSSDFKQASTALNVLHKCILLKQLWVVSSYSLHHSARWRSGL